MFDIIVDVGGDIGQAPMIPKQRQQRFLRMSVCAREEACKPQRGFSFPLTKRAFEPPVLGIVRAP